MKRISIRSALVIVTALLIAAATAGAAYAYFTDYDNMIGAARVNLSGQSEVDEDVTDKSKTISIRNTGEQGKNASVAARLIIYGPEGMTVTLSESSDWTKFDTEEGVYGYYYNHVLAPGESTSKITASIDGIPVSADMSEFDIIVLQESAAVVYDEDGKVSAPQGWIGFPDISE